MENVLLDYILDDALIVIPVLWIVGKILKETPSLWDWLIPYILTVIGVVLAVFLTGFNVDGIIQGLLVSGAAIYGNQLYKQAMERFEI